MSPSGYDKLAKHARKQSKRCSLVVITAVFGRKDKLQQPEHVPPAMADCYFAIVDEASADFLQQTASKSIRRSGQLSDERIGAWRLLTLSASPYASARRASRVPKLLPFRVFASANYSLWVDGKLKLLVDPHRLLQRFLREPRAKLALARNLRRDSIDEEMRWIRGTLASEPAKLVASDAKAVEAQWAFYKAASSEEEEEEEEAPAAWMRRTACAEGAMILADLRSPLTRCVLCAWFNEWHRFGERDQLSLSYVLHAMGLTPPPEPPPPSERTRHGHGHTHDTARHRGVFLWPRHEHWNYKRAKDEPKRKAYVKYVGHGGCLNKPEKQKRPNPGCPSA